MKKIWLGVVAGLVAAALVVGAFILGQRSDGDVADPPPPSPSTAPTPGPGGSESPSHDGGRAIAKGTVTAGEGGTTEGPGGVMLGYEPTEDGAVQAATNYQAYFHSTAIKDADVRKQVIEAVAVDEAAQAGLERDGRAVSDYYTQEKIPGLEVESERGAYAVESFTPEKAQILLWTPWNTQWAEDAAWESTWALGRVTVVWERGDWRIEQFPPEASASIPYPADPEGNPSPQEKWALLREPAPEDYEVEEIPEFYRNEWLEYANAAR